MVDPAPDPKRAKFPLADQAAEAQRELGLRYKVYSARVAAKKMTRDEADRLIALMRAMRDTLRLFAEHEDAVRATVAYEIRRKREAAEHAAEVEALRAHPAVQTVLQHFPDADVGLPSVPSAEAVETAEAHPVGPEAEEPAAA